MSGYKKATHDLRSEAENVHPIRIASADPLGPFHPAPRHTADAQPRRSPTRADLRTASPTGSLPFGPAHNAFILGAPGEPELWPGVRCGYMRVCCRTIPFSTKGTAI